MTESNVDIHEQLMTAARDAAEPSDGLHRRVLAASLSALDRHESPFRSEGQELQPDLPSTPFKPAEPAESDEVSNRRPARSMWVGALQKNAVRYTALAAAIGIVILGGLVPWSSSSKDNQWWAGPAASWAQEIHAALNRVSSITSRGRTVFVMPDGRRHLSTTIKRSYTSADSYRNDIWDDDQLREVQWYTPEGSDMIQTSIRYDTGTTTVLRHEGSFGNMDPIARMRATVERAEGAGDVELTLVQLEGESCLMFELAQPDNDDPSKTTLERVWFDPQTKLPVRTEFEYEHPSEEFAKAILVEDQFDWNPTLPPETFTPHQITDAATSRPE